MLLLTNQPVPLRTDTEGVVRVGRTRVSLDSVVCAYHNGATAEQIVEDFPTLDLADVHAVISYYLRHSSAVEEYLAAQAGRSADVRNQIQPIVASEGVRQRLLARRANKDNTDAAPGG